MTSPHPTADYAWSVRGWLSEGPGAHPAEPELWVYADRFSYRAGERVGLHVHTTAAHYDLEIVRDGARPRTVAFHRGLPGAAHPTPPNAHEIGCGWPTALTVEIADDWESGMYLVVVRTEHEGRVHEREGFFVVRATVPTAGIALVHTTGTLLAYNDWGGANHYRGLPDGHLDDIPAPVVSAQRPLARGLLRKPDGAPRNVHTDTPPPGWIPRHPAYEWAMVNGYTRHHADAFWATYERPFTVWAENNGFRLDHLTQHDLHDDAAALDGYACAVLVGHDEYWTWEMRDAVDRFTDSGGGLARFAGNFIWQTRWDAVTRRQTCHKDPRLDPLFGTAEQHRVTTAWDWEPIARPPGESLGLSGLMGSYNRYGSAVPRSTGGYTVYRPEHWALTGTDLYYGDTFGGAPICIAAFELDGADYTFHRGLPHATGDDGAPDSLEIVAMTPAVIGAEDRWQGRVPLGAPEAEVTGLISAMYPEGAPPHLRDLRYGSGMVATFTRGAGEVFNAGSTEWVSGLIHHDPFTEQITRNVLDRFAGGLHRKELPVQPEQTRHNAQENA